MTSSLGDVTYRDAMVKIAMKSEHFSIFSHLTKQKDFKALNENFSAPVEDALNNCLTLTETTELIDLLNWSKEWAFYITN